MFGEAFVTGIGTDEGFEGAFVVFLFNAVEAVDEGVVAWGDGGQVWFFFFEFFPDEGFFLPGGDFFGDGVVEIVVHGFVGDDGGEGFGRGASVFFVNEDDLLPVDAEPAEGVEVFHFFIEEGEVFEEDADGFLDDEVEGGLAAGADHHVEGFDDGLVACASEEADHGVFTLGVGGG